MDFFQLKQYLNQQVIGQSHLTNRILIALLANGHLLVEGAPGLAKTRSIQTLSNVVEGTFQRIQFTPDLLPSDITGSEIYTQQSGSFSFRSGPIFNNLILADEINRAPAKVQSALLEAMSEHRITVAGESYELPKPFLVMATQNPIENEGTYNLPEAQLDRFLMHVLVDYPNLTNEKQILQINRMEAQQAEKTDDADSDEVSDKLSQATIATSRQQVMDVHLSEPVEEYILQLVMATRQPQHYSQHLSQLIEFGASPRATIALDRCARAHAWLNGNDFVSPEDVQAVVHDILRHRLILSFHAQAEGFSKDLLIDELLNTVSVA